MSGVGSVTEQTKQKKKSDSNTNETGRFFEETNAAEGYCLDSST